MNNSESQNPTRAAKTVRRKSGRENKGTRLPLLTRVPRELHVLVLASMKSLNLNQNDYLALLISITHGYPISALTRAEKISSAAGRRRPASRFDLPDANDVDVRAVVEDLRAAVARSGMPHGAFAAAIGIPRSLLDSYLDHRLMPPAHLHLRAERVSTGVHLAKRSGWSSAFVSSMPIRDALRVDDEAWALDLCIKTRADLREALADAPSAAAAWEAIPIETGRVEWDAFLAAIVSHEFTLADRQPPTWTASSRFRLDGAWVFGSSSLTSLEIRSQTPEWLAERNLFVSKLDLMDSDET